MAAGAEAERNRAGMSEPMAKTALPGGPRVRPSLEGLRSLRLEGDQRGASGERPRRARYYGARPALAGGAVLLVLVAYVVAARGPFRPPVVEVSRVVASGGEADSVSPSLTLTGYVVTRRKYVDLGATVPGRIAWIGVEEGDRFEAGQNVRVCVRKKRVGVEKIRSAKHVIHRARAVVILARVQTHPRSDRAELKVLLRFPSLVHRGGVRLPATILHVRRKYPRDR